MRKSHLIKAGKCFGLDVYIDPDLPPDTLKIVGGTPEKPHAVTLRGLKP